jgi:hypothetical protein
MDRTTAPDPMEKQKMFLHIIERHFLSHPAYITLTTSTELSPGEVFILVYVFRL